LLDALDRERIEFLTLKGLLLALTVYDNLKLRSLGVDVDLLFRKGDLTRLEGILREMGYEMTSVLKRKDVERQLQVEGLTLRYRSPHGAILEAHTDLTPFLAENRIDSEKIFDRAMAFEARGRTLRALSPGDLTSHLSLHLHKHFSLQGAPLIWWCDLAESIKRFGAHIDGSQIRSYLASRSAFETVSAVLDVANRWFSIPALDGFPEGDKSETREIEARLLRDLKEGPRERVGVPESFVRRLGRSEGIGDALKALWLDLFPSPEFMMRRYRVRQKSLAYLLYPFRWLDAIRLEIGRMFQRKQ
jgi:hypothetical protein